MKWILLAGVLALLVTGCSDSSAEPDPTLPPVVGVSSTTTAVPETLAPPPTTAPPRTFEDEGSAFAFLFEYNALTGDPEELRAALERIGGHRSGLATPTWLLLGDDSTRRAIFDVLADGGHWNAQILTAMLQYGAPIGSYDVRQEWDPAVRVGLADAQRSALDKTFGDLSSIALVVQERMLEAEILRCLEESCEWAGAWYDVPQAVSLIEGEPQGNQFDGEVGVTSDTGELSFLPIVLQQTADQWLITEGYLTEVRTPVIVVENPIDGIHLIEDFAALWGFAEPGSSVIVGNETIEVDAAQYWEAGVPLQPGRNDITIRVTNESGGSATATKTVYHHPNGIELFGYFTLGETPGTLLFNEAEILYGAEADAAAVAAGQIADGETLPAGFFIADDDPETIVEYPISPDAFVALFDSAIESVPVTYSTFLGFIEGAPSTGYYGNLPTEPYWLLVDGGEVIQFVQQYVP